LISWGKDYFRPFPWRLTDDPYTILMAEIMLHRTQVAQVVPVFQTFIARYPDVVSLVHANQQELSTVLSPLGLHWRIDLIYSMGQKILNQFAMQIPKEKNDLLSLPGVSEYIASAVRCFAWNLPEPLIDTNTTRITGRVFGMETKDSSRRNSRFRNLIDTLLDPNDPRSHNYALLDLAHLICLKKQDPICQKCPVLTFCCFGQSRLKLPL
jgi:A/G-specific adenine glycosylase